MPFPYEITYETLLNGIHAVTFGDEGPDYLVCGVGTFDAIYRWVRETERINAQERDEIPWVTPTDKLVLEGIVLIPVMGFAEGIIIPVNISHRHDPRYCTTIILPEKSKLGVSV